MKIKVKEEELCAILVYGVVPELMPHCAFRREKHFSHIAEDRGIFNAPAFIGKILTGCDQPFKGDDDTPTEE